MRRGLSISPASRAPTGRAPPERESGCHRAGSRCSRCSRGRSGPASRPRARRCRGGEGARASVDPAAVDEQRLVAVVQRRPLDRLLVEVEPRSALGDPVEQLEAIGVVLIHRGHHDHDSGGGIGGCAGVSLTPAYPPGWAVLCLPRPSDDRASGTLWVLRWRRIALLAGCVTPPRVRSDSASRRPHMPSGAAPPAVLLRGEVVARATRSRLPPGETARPWGKLQGNPEGPRRDAA